MKIRLNIFLEIKKCLNVNTIVALENKEWNQLQGDTTVLTF